MIRNGLRTRPKGTRPTPAGTAAPAIDADLLRTLATLISDSDLAEMEIEKGDLRIKLVRHTATSHAPAPQVTTPMLVAAAMPAAAAAAPAIPAAEHPGAVKSPMVGTVYRRASPEAKAFVEVGSTVKAGDKILLVEAMKTFNEIVAPRAGTISAVLVDDGQPVEYGQPLLVIE
ncbi:acetyl-CoA carboxylase biotin carboxyl carrier protein [Lichenibacterium ramalinae]|uniref:Biotin carboxyl carrier protein of acetyl-CoA carboxylase n=1 Tax=Lichenibacterium ramalinae TaxID=2316527 RepID=A0A4Q2RI09_9HYPH|nr:acetyl-CoA carboxylase biotin carboxyl carrier protein [Lichenibacterium ramalinae]